jgi:hypothetical protein
LSACVAFFACAFSSAFVIFASSAEVLMPVCSLAEVLDEAGGAVDAVLLPPCAGATSEPSSVAPGGLLAVCVVVVVTVEFDVAVLAAPVLDEDFSLEAQAASDERAASVNAKANVRIDSRFDCVSVEVMKTAGAAAKGARF